jgi:hypothetical protein
MSISLTPPPAMDKRSAGRATKALLACGVAYSVSFVAFGDLLASLLYGDYDPVDQTISELSARGASTRPLLVVLGPIWSALLVAFGIGVLRAANDNRLLRVTGGLLIAHGVVNVLWFWFPMTARGDFVSGSPEWNDVGHLALVTWAGLFALAEIGCGAAALKRRFRVYSIVTVGTALVFGGLTGAQAANLVDGESTPLMGVYERVNVGAWLLWIAVLSVMLLRGREDRASRAPETRPSRSTS